MSQSAPALLPIFRSDSQMRLLGQLFLNPDREQTIAELEAATGVPQQTLSREVNRLLETGLLEGRRLGRLHLVKANRSSPFFPELAGLLLKAVGPVRVLSELLHHLARVEAVYLFGSWARRYHGEPGLPPGDIDVLVIGEPDVDEVYGACSEAAQTLGQEVNSVMMTADEWKAGRSGFIRQLQSGPLVEVGLG